MESKEFWDKRYGAAAAEGGGGDNEFEWFGGYQVYKTVLDQYLHPEQRILVVGCGNSGLSTQLWQHGYGNICSIDFSSVVIEKQLCAHPQMQWRVMDIRQMDEFDSAQFDIVIDKGTLDSMYSAASSVWDPEPQVVDNVTRALKEIRRVMHGNGKFIYITWQQPRFRQEQLKQLFPSIHVEKIGGQGILEYYVHICSS